MNAITFCCPMCQGQLCFSEESLGKKITCNHCQKAVNAPGGKLTRKALFILLLATFTSICSVVFITVNKTDEKPAANAPQVEIREVIAKQRFHYTKAQKEHEIATLDKFTEELFALLQDPDLNLSESPTAEEVKQKTILSFQSCNKISAMDIPKFYDSDIQILSVILKARTLEMAYQMTFLYALTLSQNQGLGSLSKEVVKNVTEIRNDIQSTLDKTQEDLEKAPTID